MQLQVIQRVQLLQVILNQELSIVVPFELKTISLYFSKINKIQEKSRKSRKIKKNLQVQLVQEFVMKLLFQNEVILVLAARIGFCLKLKELNIYI